MQQLKNILEKYGVQYNVEGEKLFIDPDKYIAAYENPSFPPEIRALTGIKWHGSLGPTKDGGTISKMWVTAD